MRTRNEGQREKHSQSVNGRRDKSRHRSKPAVREGNSLSVERGGWDTLTQRIKASKRQALTFCSAQRKGEMRIQKESQRAIDTHQLSNTGGGTGQNAERKRASEEHSPSVGCRVQSGGQVRTPEKIQWVSHEGHSLPVERGGWDR
jgi:hypothetical protein